MLNTFDSKKQLCIWIRISILRGNGHFIWIEILKETMRNHCGHILYTGSYGVGCWESAAHPQSQAQDSYLIKWEACMEFTVALCEFCIFQHLTLCITNRETTETAETMTITLDYS